jgi:fatty acid synthase
MKRLGEDTEESAEDAGLIKVLLAYENGVLPPNLHYREPNPNSEGLQKGALQVVTEPTEFNGGIVALSSFGFGGELVCNPALSA